jgi:glycerol uptake facilitator-like aquaporin
MMEPHPLYRRAMAELVGTAFLLAAVVGSGIMGERLAQGNEAVALLANALATGAALVALILLFQPISGAHFNPLVTMAMAIRRDLPWADAPIYVAAQIGGALLGVAVAHGMFELPTYSLSSHVRQGLAQAGSEIVATLGLILLIWRLSLVRGEAIAYAVGAYIAAAYWFTASTSFANPAVTVARALTDTFAGIRPADVPAFLVAQALGLALAVALGRWFEAPPKS